MSGTFLQTQLLLTKRPYFTICCSLLQLQSFSLPPRKPLSLSRYWALVPGIGLIIVGCLINISKSAQLVFPVPYSILATAASLEIGIDRNRPFGYYTSQHIAIDRIIKASFQPGRQFKKIV